MSEGAHVHPKGSRVKSVAVAQAPRCPFICIWLYDCICMYVFLLSIIIYIYLIIYYYIYMFILLYIYLVWFYRRHVVASLDMMLNNECSRPCKKQPSPLSKDPPSNFPYKMGGLKATKWVFYGSFCSEATLWKGPRPTSTLDGKSLCRKKSRGPWMKIEIWSKKRLSKARQFVVKLPSPMADSSRLEPLHFVVNPLCFWKKMKRRKTIYQKKARQA